MKSTLFVFWLISLYVRFIYVNLWGISYVEPMRYDPRKSWRLYSSYREDETWLGIMVLFGSFYKLFYSSLSRLALYALVILSTFSLGNPRSINSLFNTVSVTWKTIEFLSIKESVETTALISYTSRPVPVNNLTALVD